MLNNKSVVGTCQPRSLIAPNGEQALPISGTVTVKYFGKYDVVTMFAAFCLGSAIMPTNINNLPMGGFGLQILGKKNRCRISFIKTFLKSH